LKRTLCRRANGKLFESKQEENNLKQYLVIRERTEIKEIQTGDAKMMHSWYLTPLLYKTIKHITCKSHLEGERWK
jgi:hypothetical protein